MASWKRTGAIRHSGGGAHGSSMFSVNTPARAIGSIISPRSMHLPVRAPAQWLPPGTLSGMLFDPFDQWKTHWE
jgi:hypothetical protein